MRSQLDTLGQQFPYAKFYLIANSAMALDQQRAVNAYFPAYENFLNLCLSSLIGITFAVLFIYIGIMFKSVFVPLRLIFSVFLSIIWVYGMSVIIFQEYGHLADIFPTLSISHGIYWLIPIMTFSIMVGLALDYDVFLFSRIVEYRDKGFRYFFNFYTLNDSVTLTQL